MEKYETDFIYFLNMNKEKYKKKSMENYENTPVGNDLSYIDYKSFYFSANTMTSSTDKISIGFTINTPESWLKHSSYIYL